MTVFLACFLTDTMATIVIASFVLLFVDACSAHGRMWDPAGRSTMWRVGYDTPHNYNDMENFCGGFYVSTLVCIS